MEPGEECYLTSLPIELHLRIRNELLKDPYGVPGEYNHFKSLRLVCKLFDLVWSPIVLVNLSLFPNNPNHNFDLKRLGRLVDGKSDFRTFDTITLKNWHYLNTGFHYFFKRLTKLWASDWKMALIEIPLTLILAIPVNLAIFFGAPTRILPRLQTFSTVLRARRYASKLPHKLQLPNVTCVRLVVHPHDTRWEIYWTTRFITMVPNLTKLVLRLSADADMAYIAKRLNPLRTLKKLTVQSCSFPDMLPPGPRSKLSFFSPVIARNPNLTHLELVLSGCTRCDLSEMLHDVPDNRPLRLEHVSIYCFYKNPDALLPHIQTLSSLETRFNNMKNDIYSMLNRTLVYPPTISADSLEPDLCMYLERHPGVINFSISHYGSLGSSHEDYGLSKIIMRHSRTLRKLRARSHMLLTLNAEVALLKCVELSELVLTRGCAVYDRVAVVIGHDIEDDKHVLNIAARLSRSLTVVIEHRTAFLGCIQYCRDSGNPLLRDLTGRIVYEKPDGIPD